MGRQQRNGYKPGDIPVSRPLPLHVFLVLPPSDDSHKSKLLRAEIDDWRSRSGARVSIIRTVSRRSKEGHELHLLRPDDVRALYRLCHEAYVVVLAFDAARVQLDVSERPSRPGSLPLESFVQYKARFERPSDLASLRDLLPSLSIQDSGCEDFRDPRCLPFAIFEPKEFLDLTDAAARKQFKRAHKNRQNNALSDKGARVWSFGPFHSMDLLHVAGCVLPYGFHWDVTTRRDWTILNGWERWTLPGNRYVNVHPNGYIRSTSATRTHGLDDLQDTTEPRTPAYKRRGKK